jgi:hypothetical protein
MVSTIVRSYKSAVTKHANRLGLPNGWQPGFHDLIIRNKASTHAMANLHLQSGHPSCLMVRIVVAGTALSVSKRTVGASRVMFPPVIN